MRVVVDLVIEMEQSFLPSGTGGPMARRTFDVIDVTEILVHWHAGRSLNEMSGSLGVDRKTIRKYVTPAVAAGIVPGGPAITAKRSHIRFYAVGPIRDVCECIRAG